jgi:hypothetical protein
METPKWSSITWRIWGTPLHFRKPPNDDDNHDEDDDDDYRYYHCQSDNIDRGMDIAVDVDVDMAVSVDVHRF